MKLRTIGILGLFIAGQAAFVYAQEGLKDRSELVGTWLLSGTAIRRDGEKQPESSTWEFTPEGRVNTASFYKFAAGGLFGEGAQGKTTDTYDVKDGKLVTGRGTYELLERQGDEMILKSQGLFYFFKKQAPQEEAK